MFFYYLFVRIIWLHIVSIYVIKKIKTVLLNKNMIKTEDGVIKPTSNKVIISIMTKLNTTNFKK